MAADDFEGLTGKLPKFEGLTSAELVIRKSVLQKLGQLAEVIGEMNHALRRWRQQSPHLASDLAGSPSIGHTLNVMAVMNVLDSVDELLGSLESSMMLGISGTTELAPKNRRTLMLGWHYREDQWAAIRATDLCRSGIAKLRELGFANNSVTNNANVDTVVECLTLACDELNQINANDSSNATTKEDKRATNPKRGTSVRKMGRPTKASTGKSHEEEDGIFTDWQNRQRGITAETFATSKGIKVEKLRLIIRRVRDRNRK